MSDTLRASYAGAFDGRLPVGENVALLVVDLLDALL